MNRLSRRRFVNFSLGLGILAAGFKAPVLWMRQALAAWPEDAFRAPSVSAAIRALFGALTAEESAQVHLSIPGLAEDGAVVPLEIEWELPAVQQIALFAEKNPVPLLASFVPADQRLQGYLATRIKLAESSNVHVVVKSNDKLYSTRRFVTVIKGGCG